MTPSNQIGLNSLAGLGLRLALAAKLGRDRAPRVESTGPVSWPRDRIKIGAVQWKADPVAHVEDWSRRIRRLFEEAADIHCHLIVFPEYLPLSLMGAIMPESASVSSLTDGAIQGFLRSVAPVTFRHWHSWMASLSRRFSMVTIAGSGLTVSHGALINLALGFNSDGSVLFSQPKWHPLPDEVRWGIAKGPVRAPQVSGPWGLSVLVCNDATYFESFRMLQTLDAKVVAVPIADPEARYTEGKARRGCFSRVQDVPMVGVVGAATGRLFGLRLTGKAGIYLPAALTPNASGILAESTHPVGEGLVSAVVSLALVEDYQKAQRAEHPVPPGDFVQALYQFKEDL